MLFELITAHTTWHHPLTTIFLKRQIPYKPMELQTAKGTRDILPEEQIVRDEIIAKLKKLFELYGFAPLGTPILERFETLAAKYAGGEEILKETFRLRDQGGRELGLRYDLTVPLARFIGMNPSLKMPFKRYQFGEVFRDGPVKLGRCREFMQCDIDIIGVASMRAEAELIGVAQEFFKAVKVPIIIELNNRKVLEGLMESLGIVKESRTAIILSIDKLKKIGLEGVRQELNEKGLLGKNTQKLLELINIRGSNQQKVAKLSKAIATETGRKGLEEIKDILGYCKTVIFTPSLARGLSYYTGTIFEVFAKKAKVSSSLAGGGRYDNMIGDYAANKSYPAVGISFGMEPIFEAVKAGIRILRKTKTEAYVLPIKTEKRCVAIIKRLREAGVNTEMDLMERGVTKNLEYASSLGIPYVLFVGEQELKKKKVKLRDMRSGKEQLLSLDGAIKRIKQQ